MATDVLPEVKGGQPPPASEPSLTSLMAGITSDLTELVGHQIQFARAEIKSDFEKTATASQVLLLGFGVAAIGVLLLALMLAHLLTWLTLPAGTEQAALPLWVSFGIVGGGFSLAGAFLVEMGRVKFQQFNPLPDKTAQVVKENLQWLTNSK